MSNCRRSVEILIAAALILQAAFLHAGEDGPFDSVQAEISKREQDEIHRLEIEFLFGQKYGRLWSSVRRFRDIPEQSQSVSPRLLDLRKSHTQRMLKVAADSSVRELSVILEDESRSMATRIRAAQMLGTLRSSQAVDALLRQMTVVDTPIRIQLIGPPCIDSLIQIGKPASDRAIALLAQEQDAERFAYLCRILVGVEGKDVAVFRLKREIERAKDEKNRIRLSQAVRNIDQS